MGGRLWIVWDTLSILGVRRYSRHRGLIMGGHLWIVWDTLSILGVRGYSDTGDRGHGWTSPDSVGYPEYPWCTQILRHRGLIMGGRPWIVRNTQTQGIGHGWTSLDSLGYLGYPWCKH